MIDNAPQVQLIILQTTFQTPYFIMSCAPLADVRNCVAKRAPDRTVMLSTLTKAGITPCITWFGGVPGSNRLVTVARRLSVTKDVLKLVLIFSMPDNSTLRYGSDIKYC